VKAARASVFIVVALATVGCGSARKSPQSTRDTGAPEARTSEPATESPKSSRPGTGAEKFSGQSRKTYETARFLCGSKPPKSVARDLGLSVTGKSVEELGRIAEAYAGGYVGDQHQPAFEGCLDGLPSRG
jgi:hypothetical protein